MLTLVLGIFALLFVAMSVADHLRAMRIKKMGCPLLLDYIYARNYSLKNNISRLVVILFIIAANYYILNL